MQFLQAEVKVHTSKPCEELAFNHDETLSNSLTSMGLAGGNAGVQELRNKYGGHNT